MVQVTLLVPSPLRAHADGHSEVRVEAVSVGGALHAARARHEQLVQRVLTRDGQLRPFVNLFVRNQDVRALDGLDTALNDGETVVIVPSVAGG